jgi:nitrogen fixation protein NifQ
MQASVRDQDLLASLLGLRGSEARFSAEVAERRVEFDALTQLLLDHRGGDFPETVDVARAIAAGCLGQRHLWRDLELPDRATLRAIFEGYFTPLAARNDRDMRWKRFLYKCLCRWEGFGTCRAPTCDRCSDYPVCFAPEE